MEIFFFSLISVLCISNTTTNNECHTTTSECTI